MVILITESLNWTAQPSNPTPAIKGQDMTLTWNYSLTANELLKSQTYYSIIWTRLIQSSSNYDQIGSIHFVKAIGFPAFSEPNAPHVVIDRNDPATLHIKDVRTEDEGKYKIEYILELDGTVLAHQEVNLTVLGKPRDFIVRTDVRFDEYLYLVLLLHHPQLFWTELSSNLI